MSAPETEIVIDLDAEQVLINHAAFIELVLRLVDVTVIFSILHSHHLRHPCAASVCTANADLAMAEAAKITEEFRELAEAVLSPEGSMVRAHEFVNEHNAALIALGLKEVGAHGAAN